MFEIERKNITLLLYFYVIEYNDEDYPKAIGQVREIRK
jgi:hypothetical protein